MNRNIVSGLTTLAALLIATSSIHAQTIPNPGSIPKSMVHPFGPRTFLKSKDLPKKRTVNFDVPSVTGTYFITVVKRTDKAKAKIKLNGQRIIGPNKFSRDRLVYRAQISPQLQNTLEIEPMGPKGSRVEVLVSGVCDMDALPIEERNIAFDEVIWQQSFSVNQPVTIENVAAQLDNLNGLFWLEMVNGDSSGQNKVKKGEVCFGDDHCLGKNDIKKSSVRVPLVPDTITDLRVDLKKPNDGQMTLKIVGICVEPDSSPIGSGPVIAAARESGDGNGLASGIAYSLDKALLLEPGAKSKSTFAITIEGVAVGSLKLRMVQGEGVTDNAAFFNEEVQTESVFIQEVEGEDEREIQDTFQFCMQGNAQGKAQIELVECIIQEGEVQDEAVIATLDILVKDFDFEINGQCPSRNCPSTDECGPLGCLKQDGYAMLISQGLFQPSFTVLPGAMGRNGLSPSWLLRYSSRAHSCGGHFGTTAFTLPCFERMRKDSSGDYVYQEAKVREFTFSNSVSTAALTGWSADERYEVLYIQANELVLRYPNGTKLFFYPVSDENYYSGALKRIENRFGDSMTLTYDVNGTGELQYITDVYGRQINFQYDDSCRVSRIHEETKFLKGRDVEFTYDADNRLETIRTAKVLTDGGIGNQFPNGKTWKFTYQTAVGTLELDTNIASIIAPNENAASSSTPFVSNVYGSSSGTTEYDRVTSQNWGGTNASGRNAGGSVAYAYDFSDPPAPKNTVTDRNGNQTEYTFDDCLCHAVKVVEKTNRNVRSGEGDYTTLLTFNNDGEITSITYPEGNSVQNVYDVGNVNRSAQGNLLSTTRIAGPRGGNGSGSSINNIETSYTYEPIFQSIRTMTSARGNDSGFKPPEGGLSVRPIDFELAGTTVTNQKARYTSLTLYDYQEGDKTAIQNFATSEKIEISIFKADALTLNTDQNQDGLTNQQFGLPIESCAPNSQTWSVNFSTRDSQSIVTTRHYNSFGLLIALISPEGYKSEFQYGPSNDPDGSVSSAATGGYPALVTVDKTTAIRTPLQSTSRTQISQQLNHDSVGNRIETIDGLGITHTAIVNELNQIQVTVQAASAPAGITTLAYSSRVFYDANNNVVKSEKENKAPSAYGSPATLVGSNPWFTTTMEYDILNNLIASTSEVQASASESVTILGESFTVGRSTSASFNNTVTTKFFHDRNQHTVLVQSPLSVTGVEANNVSSSIYDERDLPFKSSQGGIDSSFASVTPFPSGVSTPSGVSNTSLTGTWTTNYDGNKNSLESIDAEDNGTAGADTSMVVYDGFDRAVKRIDAFGNDSTTDFDPDSQAVAMASYGPDGENKAATPGNRKLLASSRSNYDELGRGFKSETDLFNTPGGTITDTYESKPRFDRQSRAIALQDSRGNISFSEFDGVDRVVKSTDSVGNYASILYDDNSNMIQRTTVEIEGGSIQTFFTDFQHDALNRQLLVVDSLGNTVRSYYNSRNHLVAQSDANSSLSSTISVSPRSGNTSISGNGEGNRIFHIYDGLSRKIQMTTELRVDHDGSKAIDTGNTFNADGLISVSTFYDDNGRTIKETDDKGNATSYVFDPRNRRTQIIFADTKTQSWQYDRESHVTQYTDQRGVTMSTAPNTDIDANGRIIAMNFSLVTNVEGTTQQTYEYDGLGRITRLTDNNTTSTLDDSVVEYKYDSIGRCIEDNQSIGSNAGAVNSTYDENSNMTSLTYPHKISSSSRHKLNYVYDALDRGIQIIDDDTSDIQAQYSFFGPSRIKQRVVNAVGDGSNQVFSNYAYDGNKRVIRISHGNIFQPDGSGVIPMFWNYAYDRNDNVICEDNGALSFFTNNGRDLYSYDSANRLVHESRKSPGSTIIKTGVVNNQAANPSSPTTFAEQRSWSLDGVTNWRSVETTPSSGPIVTDSYTVNTVNEYSSINSQSRTHDDFGSLTNDGQFIYKYDALKRLVRVISVSSGQTVMTNTWDAANRRTSRSITNSGSLNETRLFYFGGSTLLEEADNNNVPQQQFQYGIMNDPYLSIQPDGSGINRFVSIPKLSGSIVAYVDESRKVCEAFDYNVQGTVKEIDVGVDNRYYTSDDTFNSVDLSSGEFLAAGLQYDPVVDLNFLGTSHYSSATGRPISPLSNPFHSLYGNAFGINVLLQAANAANGGGNGQQPAGEPTPPAETPPEYYGEATPKGCPAMKGIPPAMRSAANQKRYNCSGLAFRLFRFINLAQTKSTLNANGNKASCDSNAKCKKCDVKFWTWENHHINVIVKIAILDGAGLKGNGDPIWEPRRVQPQDLKITDSRNHGSWNEDNPLPFIKNFHIVSGQMNRHKIGPLSVNSKNGLDDPLNPPSGKTRPPLNWVNNQDTEFTWYGYPGLHLREYYRPNPVYNPFLPVGPRNSVHLPAIAVAYKYVGVQVAVKPTCFCMRVKVFNKLK